MYTKTERSHRPRRYRLPQLLLVPALLDDWSLRTLAATSKEIFNKLRPFIVQRTIHFTEIPVAPSAPRKLISVATATRPELMRCFASISRKWRCDFEDCRSRTDLTICYQTINDHYQRLGAYCEKHHQPTPGHRYDKYVIDSDGKMHPIEKDIDPATCVKNGESFTTMGLRCDRCQLKVYSRFHIPLFTCTRIGTTHTNNLCIECLKKTIVHTIFVANCEVCGKQKSIRDLKVVQPATNYSFLICADMRNHDYEGHKCVICKNTGWDKWKKLSTGTKVAASCCKMHITTYEERAFIKGEKDRKDRKGEGESTENHRPWAPANRITFANLQLGAFNRPSLVWYLYFWEGG